jgi:hypothetical protein
MIAEICPKFLLNFPNRELLLLIFLLLKPSLLYHMYQSYRNFLLPCMHNKYSISENKHFIPEIAMYYDRIKSEFNTLHKLLREDQALATSHLQILWA